MYDANGGGDSGPVVTLVGAALAVTLAVRLQNVEMCTKVPAKSDF